MIKVHDYQCTDCNHIFEKFVTTEGTPQACPVCGSPETMRITSSTAFKVTGQGQYSSKMKV